MSRLPLVSPNELDAEQKAFWDYIVHGPRGASLREPLTSLPGPFNPWMQIPSFGRVAAEMGERLRFCSVLPGKLRELAILTTGVRWKAEFEFWAHARVAPRVCLTQSSKLCGWERRCRTKTIYNVAFM
jgi:4-carboxymuconolactone decarboxylase